jgi:hypothetical protein
LQLSGVSSRRISDLRVKSKEAGRLNGFWQLSGVRQGRFLQVPGTSSRISKGEKRDSVASCNYWVHYPGSQSGETREVRVNRQEDRLNGLLSGASSEISKRKRKEVRNFLQVSGVSSRVPKGKGKRREGRLRGFLWLSGAPSRMSERREARGKSKTKKVKRREEKQRSLAVNRRVVQDFKTRKEAGNCLAGFRY